MTVRREEASKFAINSYSYTIDHSARQFLDKLAARGHRSFELMVYPGHLWPKDLSAADRTSLRRHVEACGLEAGIGTLIGFSTQPGNYALDGDGRKKSLPSARGVLH